MSLFAAQQSFHLEVYSLFLIIKRLSFFVSLLTTGISDIALQLQFQSTAQQWGSSTARSAASALMYIPYCTAIV